MARITGANPGAVTQWRRIGIPARYWPDLVELAREQGMREITFGTLRATKPAKADAA